MIVRILGEGQLDVADSELDGLNSLDADLQSAVESDEEDRFLQALVTLLSKVREVGRPLHASLAEVRELLGDEGLIPG